MCTHNRKPCADVNIFESCDRYLTTKLRPVQDTRKQKRLTTEANVSNATGNKEYFGGLWVFKREAI